MICAVFAVRLMSRCLDTIFFAQDAKVDRATFYRAFRLENGPALDTMVRVLHVPGFRLIVKIRANSLSRRARLDASEIAGFLTVAFRRRNLNLVIEAFAETLSSQENVSELA
jgi:DNA-binding phage protein